MASSSGSKAEFIVGGKYKLVRKIGSGSFGDIYLAINITNGEVKMKWMFNYCVKYDEIRRLGDFFLAPLVTVSQIVTGLNLAMIPE